MISKRIKGRKDGKTSAGDALRYGEGLAAARDRETGEILDKSHRTRLGNFGLIDDGVYAGRNDMADLIELAALEMQANYDLNTRVGSDKKLAHFVVSFNKNKPPEAALRDTEDSMLAAMSLDKNHFATFLHNDNGYWHLHIFVSCIDKTNKHLCNPLWQDKKRRDKVCREIELRHGLARDNGLHVVDAAEQIIEIPLAERRAQREKTPKASDRAQTTERYSGEKSFQTWCSEIRIGDRLKHAKSWQDLHAAAAAYHCEVKPKGAGFVVCPIGEKGGITLSKVGLKNLTEKFGAFESAPPGQATQAQDKYTPEPTQPAAGSLYKTWKEVRDAYKGEKTEAINTQRAELASARAALRKQQRDELATIKATVSGQGRFSALSIAKLRHAVELTELAADHADVRQQLRLQLAEAGPGNTFRDYLVKQAAAGDDAALALARQYGADDATSVLRLREVEQLKVVAAASGLHDRQAPRLNFSHRVERSGTVVFNLGQGRQIIDSAIAKQIQLNNAASLDPAAVETSLRFAAAKFGNRLTLTGPADFQKLAVETAVKKGLGIRFNDPALDAYREKLEAERKAPKFTHTKENKHESRHRIQHPRQIPPAHRRDRLRSLSDVDVVLDTHRTVLPLRPHVPGRVEQPRQEKPNHRMQRAAGSTGRERSLTSFPSEHLTKRDALAGLPAAQPPKVDVQATDPRKALTALYTGSREPNARERCIGKVLAVTKHEVAQDVGRGNIVIHQRELFPAQYATPGRMADVQYREKGKAAEPNDSNKARGPVLKDMLRT